MEQEAVVHFFPAIYLCFEKVGLDCGNLISSPFTCDKTIKKNFLIFVMDHKMKNFMYENEIIAEIGAEK